MVDDAGNFTTVILTNSRTPITLPHPQMNFWLMTLLHSWYPEIVEAQYPILMDRILLDGPQGTKLTKPVPHRSEEHTSELQSLMRISYAVFCLKKKHPTN